MQRQWAAGTRRSPSLCALCGGLACRLPSQNTCGLALRAGGSRLNTCPLQGSAGLLFPLPVPSRRGGCVSLDFMELPTAVSDHDFLQVHIDLLTGRVWLVPTFKTATSDVAARNFVNSVFRDVGLPDTIVSDRDTRFTSSFWTALHEALGASLIFGSPHHHNTTSKGRTCYWRHC